MALSRRSGTRFQSSIWPGFVDAMTGLLLVLMFVLTIFMVVQFVLTERISGQENELDSLAGEVAALAQALGLEERTSAQLEARLGALNASLNQARDTAETQAALISSLTSERDRQAAALAGAQTQITSFEAQVAALLNERDTALGQVENLEARTSEMLSEQEALDLALAAARSEMDAQAEAARLAAAQREALDAMIEDLRAEKAATEGQVAELTTQLDTSTEQLDAAETARLVEAAAAEALRARLQNADAELTAMTLALEAQRKSAEDTLTLLAAARSVRGDLDAQLAEALLKLGSAEQSAQSNAGAQTEVLRLREEVSDLKAQLAQTDQTAQSTQAELDATEVARADLQQQLDAARAGLTADREQLRAQLAEALAAKLAAQTLAEDTTTAADKKAALLAAAQQQLSTEKAISAEAQRQTELLNQQVSALRAQLSELQGLLDLAAANDASKNIELQSLGSDLNTALARVAAEQRRRAELEAAERKRLEAQTRDLEQYRSEFFGRLRDILGSQDGVRIEGDRFVFSSEVLFPPGGAVLSPDGKGEIAKVADILRTISGEIPPEIDWIIRVDGHTDNLPLSGTGEFDDNWELSQARALSVVKYMINFLGIAPDRLAANGFGQYQPIAPGNDEQSRAQNRRIELKFTER
ncbi:chemotaxis protein MotB [Sulfitobacter brevis]|uniref:Chemotaxis protein MotB n=1 Tax=Sulfitobacter brevis TaxID=74348 RepID=A0A1I1T878_9RHOB|nr:peptidoglycan -binding protein [Sulfitobacter brevis]SFD53338.1 chemotaxis protein MotB [Sulfitobacter brevis]